MSTTPENILPILVKEHTGETGERSLALRTRLNLSKAAFLKARKAVRAVPKLTTLPDWRKALGMSKKKFWKRVQEHYDP